MLQRVNLARASARKCASRANKRLTSRNSRPINSTILDTPAKRLPNYSFVGVQIGVSRGRLTHAVRHQWGLNRLLNQENSKNRDDHRHHSLDALITALISPKLLKRVSRLSQELRGASLSDRLFKLPMPWKGFVNEVASKVRSIVVSHAPYNKITDGFHEETAYGKRKKEGTLALRKSLDPEAKELFISVAEVGKIRDEVVAELVKERLSAFGFDPQSSEKEKQKKILKEAFATPLFHKDGKTPIKRVRLELNKSDSSLFEVVVNGRALKYHELGGNHHVEIFKDKNGKWVGDVISTHEAMTRNREGKSPYNRTREGHDFVMTLAKQEMVEITEDGKKEYYRLQWIEAGRIRLFRKHSSAEQRGSKQADVCH